MLKPVANSSIPRPTVQAEETDQIKKKLVLNVCVKNMIEQSGAEQAHHRLGNQA